MHYKKAFFVLGVFLSISSLQGLPESCEQLRQYLRACFLADLARRQQLYFPHLVNNNNARRELTAEQVKKR